MIPTKGGNIVSMTYSDTYQGDYSRGYVLCTAGQEVAQDQVKKGIYGCQSRIIKNITHPDSTPEKLCVVNGDFNALWHILLASGL